MNEGKIKRLIVGTPQGDAGDLTKESRFAFNYTTAERAREVSLLMPIRAESYAETVLPSVFAMNQPEGFLLDKLRERFAKVVDLDDMRLLALTGENQIGRLRYREPDEKPMPIRAEVGLNTLLRSGASDELFDFLVDVYLRSGISGFQPKIMLPDADALADAAEPVATAYRVVEKATAFTPDLIVKAAGEGYPDLAQNEFLCMDAARIAGIEVPDFWLSDDGSLFIMRRFDLRGPEKLQLGFEDMAAMTLRSADRKYEGSYEQLAKVIGWYCGENRSESLSRLFEYVAMSVMVRNGDAHLKNFGLLYEHPHSAVPRLAPLFDVVTTSVYPVRDPQSGRTLTDRTMALKLNKDRQYPMRKELVEFGRNVCLVQRPEIVLDRISSAMRQSLDTHRERIEPRLFEKISVEWDSGMMSVEPAKIFTGRALKAIKGDADPGPIPD
ncbi:serine/threonine-protein kinase HipA [Paraburkholderia sp. BL23I1N1]|uniref:type II toxin-antitoxin system HipA family toxin n=1 Tax=Paraburkholderia sp. BL23I1N1 TaxID=1938802 RepID=UPI000E76EF38|nr:type II toxin-antitoxin system HipA family toxin [Paraburkholderia sp. BL23I1N1]RKE37710.1 serine/threonine-protein kinase HipA [Paraburkholderia sp. BL23I1N1]